jgi:hypothetical protein
MSTTTSSKRSARKRNYKVVLIDWGDAFIETSDFTYEDALATAPIMRQTVGFLICKNQHGYVLSTDVYDDLPEIAGKLFIPKGWVTKVTKLT